MLPVGLEVDKVSRVGWGYEVSGQYFELTRIQPGLGRLLQPADDQAGAAKVAVLSWPAWKGAFGADPDIVGKHRGNSFPVLCAAGSMTDPDSVANIGSGCPAVRVVAVAPNVPNGSQQNH